MPVDAHARRCSESQGLTLCCPSCMHAALMAELPSPRAERERERVQKVTADMLDKVRALAARAGSLPACVRVATRRRACYTHQISASRFAGRLAYAAQYRVAPTRGSRSADLRVRAASVVLAGSVHLGERERVRVRKRVRQATSWVQHARVRRAPASMRTASAHAAAYTPRVARHRVALTRALAS